MRQKKNEAMLITTEKDFVKIPEHLRNNFYTLTVDLNISNQEFVLKKIQSIIQEKN
jgi:tetraacyldisaccharide-1-P 4'-kinase